jgi:hypothetical protein
MKLTNRFMFFMFIYFEKQLASFPFMRQACKKQIYHTHPRWKKNAEHITTLMLAAARKSEYGSFHLVADAFVLVLRHSLSGNANQIDVSREECFVFILENLTNLLSPNIIAKCPFTDIRGRQQKRHPYLPLTLEWF